MQEEVNWKKFEGDVAKFFQTVFDSQDAGKKKVANYEVDCWAEANGFVFVAECKHAELTEKSILNRRDYRSEIIKFGGVKTRIHNHLNSQEKPLKPVWIFCVRGALPTEKNYEVAEEYGITIWTDEYLKLLKELKKSLKDELFWQVIKEAGYEDEKIPTTSKYPNFRYPALPRKASFRGEQVDIYNLFIPVRDLIPLSYVYRIKEDEPESYQRLLENKKLRKIGEFLDKGNTINTSLLINLPQRAFFKGQPLSEYHENIYGFISIPNIRNSVRIIDGQHRLYGFLHSEESVLDQKLPVIAMLGASASQEAQAFVDINENQKKVSTNDLLVILARTDPQGTGFVADLVIKMNESKPFKDRIMISGQRLSGGLKLTLTTIVSVLNSNNIISQKAQRKNAVVNVQDYETADLAKLDARKHIENFFNKLSQVADSVSSDWVEGFIFTNPGFQIVVPLLREANKYADDRPLGETLDEILPHTKTFLQKNATSIAEIRGNSSASARARYSIELLSSVNAELPAFAAKTIELYKNNNPSGSSEQETYIIQRAIKLEKHVKQYVWATLAKSRYGEAWFSQDEVVDKRIRDRAEEAIRAERASYYNIGETIKIKHPIFYLPLSDVINIIKKNQHLFRQVIDSGFSQFIADVDIVRIVGNKRHEDLDVKVSSTQREAFDIASKRLPKLVGQDQ